MWSDSSYFVVVLGCAHTIMSSAIWYPGKCQIETCCPRMFYVKMILFPNGKDDDLDPMENNYCKIGNTRD